MLPTLSMHVRNAGVRDVASCDHIASCCVSDRRPSKAAGTLTALLPTGLARCRNMLNRPPVVHWGTSAGTSLQV